MKPILCNTQVVQNILAGRQTQDRRPIKPQPNADCLSEVGDIVYEPISRKILKAVESNGRNKRDAGILTPKEIKPKYQVGDVLYCRETWRLNSFGDFGGEYGGWVDYKADGDSQFVNLVEAYGDFWDTEARLTRWYRKHEGDKYSPSIHMPKWAARIFLKVTAVRVERIQDIDEEDAQAEGIEGAPDLRPSGLAMNYGMGQGRYFPDYRNQFKNLWESIYPGSWDRNDWVFVYDFEMCEKP